MTYPPVPDGSTAYLVGDIHGRADLVAEVHRRIDADKAVQQPARPVEIYLGDYIDRGPDSAAVVSALIARARAVEAIFLRGNHEQMLLDYLGGRDCLAEWSAVGAFATLQSYGVPSRLLHRSVAADAVRHSFAECLPPEHLRFYEETHLYRRVGPYLAVHAGVRPGVDLERQLAADLLCIRRDFLHHEGSFGFIVVHGHTPVRLPEFRPNRINIDTGAFATNRLTCVRLGPDGVRALPHDGYPVSPA